MKIESQKWGEKCAASWHWPGGREERKREGEKYCLSRVTNRVWKQSSLKEPLAAKVESREKEREREEPLGLQNKPEAPFYLQSVLYLQSSVLRFTR